MLPIVNNDKRLDTLPDENLVRIFGFLDVKSLGVVASVCQLFEGLQADNYAWRAVCPQVTSFLTDIPSMKERVRRSQVEIGNDEQWNRCIIDFLNRTIKQVNIGNIDKTCEIAFKHPYTPKGSFVVYTWGSRQIPCAVIKSKAGNVFEITDIRWPNATAGLFITELREHVEKPTEFHEFKVILFEEHNDSFQYRNIKKATDFLKGV